MLSLGLLLVWTAAAPAQWAVHDGISFARDAAQWVEEAAQWASSLAHQAQEIENTYNIIVYQIKQYETMIQNLQRIPDGLYHDDVHGEPAWRKHMTLRLAEEIRAELQGAAP